MPYLIKPVQNLAFNIYKNVENLYYKQVPSNIGHTCCI